MSEAADGLVREMAAMPLDGEEVDGEEYAWENDDAWETLSSLISAARAIIGSDD